MLRRCVVTALAAFLLLGAVPTRASAASDNWRPLDDHYQCVWHCSQRGWMFGSAPKRGTGKKAAALRQTGAAAPAPAASTTASSPGDPQGSGDPSRTDRGTGFGFGLFSWLTSLFGDRTWKTSRPSEPSTTPQTLRGNPDDGRGRSARWGRDDPWDWGHESNSFGWGAWHNGWGDGSGWHDPWYPCDPWWGCHRPSHHCPAWVGCYRPSYPGGGWHSRSHDWDDGRDSGYTAHRHHPRGGDY